MSHNPKLNVYTLRLKKKDDSVQTFRDLFKKKFDLTDEGDSIVFKTYFSHFLNGLGKDNFRKDPKSKKVIGVQKKSDDTFSLNFHSEKNIIEGVIDGGKYGILREYADIDKKESRETLGADKAVLDKFYILINTPLNSDFGYILIQSYTEETIQEPIKEFIKPFFGHSDYFFNAVLEPYVPNKFIEEYKKNAKIRLFSFSTIIGLKSELRNDGFEIEDGTFNVEINIKPKSNINPSKESLKKILSKIGIKKFDNSELKDLNSKIFLINDKGRKANFDLEKQISDIKPTIFLKDEGIDIDKHTSLPDFSQIKSYCFDLLEIIVKEHKDKTNINEF